MLEFIDKNKEMVCSICKEVFLPDEGKHIIKNKQIICPYCIAEGRASIHGDSELLLG